MILPPRFKNASFENYKATTQNQIDIVAKLKKWVFEFTQTDHQPEYCNILLLGGLGTGKTMLSWAILRAVFQKNANIELFKCFDFLQRVKASYNEKEPDDFMGEAQELDLIVLDEIGVQYGTLADRNILYELIDYRIEYYKPTIITGNLTMGELKVAIGERCVDRLLENAIVGIFTEKSFRL